MMAPAERRVRVKPSSDTRVHSVPVTAKLSRHFYDTFGDQAVTELVDWMNAVDLSYRQDLLQINEANVARFEANSDARIAGLRTDMDRGFADLREDMDRRLGDLDGRFAVFEAKIDARFARFEARMLKWMLVFWATTMLALLQLR